jgi:hypothetical protein
MRDAEAREPVREARIVPSLPSGAIPRGDPWSAESSIVAASGSSSCRSRVGDAGPGWRNGNGANELSALWRSYLDLTELVLSHVRGAYKRHGVRWSAGAFACIASTLFIAETKPPELAMASRPSSRVHALALGALVLVASACLQQESSQLRPVTGVVWPHEPSGFTVITDWARDRVQGHGWTTRTRQPSARGCSSRATRARQAVRELR